jgi:hypothetical protein
MGQAEMIAKQRNLTRETVRGYSPAVTRERIIDPSVCITTGEDRLLYDESIDVYAYPLTQSYTMVYVEEHQTDQGWWIWTGCSVEEVMTYCRRIYNVSEDM